MWRPCRCFSSASAIGERIELKVQARSTLEGSRAIARSGPDMQDAEQREEPARRAEVDHHALGQALAQYLRAFVVQAAPSHVDRLDARRARRADRLEIALADQEIIFDDAAERRQRHQQPLDRRLVGGADIEDEAILLDAELHMERAIGGRHRLEAVLLEQVEDGDGALMLDVGVAPDDAALVEGDLGDTLVGISHALAQRRGRFSLIATESACASRPSARASVTAAGPIARRLSASQASSEVRFRKSSTPKPDEKRALRAVGR